MMIVQTLRRSTSNSLNEASSGGIRIVVNTAPSVMSVSQQAATRNIPISNSQELLPMIFAMRGARISPTPVTVRATASIPSNRRLNMGPRLLPIPLMNRLTPSSTFSPPIAPQTSPAAMMDR